MASLNNLNDLFIHHVKDLYSAETNLEKAAPSLLNAANNDELKEVLKAHSDMIPQHRSNLEKIAGELDNDVRGETCHAMLGLIKEAQQFLTEDVDKDVLDAGIIADAQRIAHYFITGYGSISNWAEELDLSDSVKENCKKGISDAEEIDQRLKKVAKSRVNEEAMS